jgi:hypothetical protein
MQKSRARTRLFFMEVGIVLEGVDAFPAWGSHLEMRWLDPGGFLHVVSPTNGYPSFPERLRQRCP